MENIMRIASLLLLALGSLLQSPANARESPSPATSPQCVTDPAQITDENCYKPPMSNLVSALLQAGIGHIKTSVHITYNEKGYITTAKLNRSTRDRNLDAAIVEWAKHMKLMPGNAGEGDWPLDLSLGR
jgi:hypothetical protein